MEKNNKLKLLLRLVSFCAFTCFLSGCDALHSTYSSGKHDSSSDTQKLKIPPGHDIKPSATETQEAKVKS